MDILAVDDDEGIREALVEILGGEGHRVRTAPDGWSALRELLHGARPDLILLDVVMPHLTGLDLVQILQKHRELAQVPVVLMTGEDCEEGLDPRVARILAKPFELEALLAALRTLGPAKAPRPGPAALSG